MSNFNNYRNLNILYSTVTNDSNIGAAQISDNQIMCGPYWDTAIDNNGFSKIKTSEDEYDLKKVIDTLPSCQKPDIVIVWADASMTNLPRNLSSINCPKVLLAGDTHHLSNPIQNLVKYAKAEPFDYVVSINNRQHAHFFIENNINSYWLPGLNAQSFKSSFNHIKEKRLTFIGQYGKYHPRRQRLINSIQQHGIPIYADILPGLQASKQYSESQCNFHCSLNGDLSFRYFEVLSAGGLLIADKLSEQSGLSLLFEDNKDLVLYNNENELIEKIHYYMNNPDKALELAQNGYNKFWEYHSSEKKSTELLDIVFKNTVNPLYEITREKRITFYSTNAKDNKLTVNNRIKAYETMQELNRINENNQILVWPKVSVTNLIDMCDLLRTHYFLFPDDADKEKKIEIMRTEGLKDNINILCNEEAFEYEYKTGLITFNEFLTLNISNAYDLGIKQFIITDIDSEDKTIILSNMFNDIEFELEVKDGLYIINNNNSNSIIDEEKTLVKNNSIYDEISNEEKAIIKQFISEDDVIFDIGSNTYNWSREVIQTIGKISCHMFEPLPIIYHKLLEEIPSELISKNYYVNNYGVSDLENIRTFYYYPQSPKLSTFNRCKHIENELDIKPEKLKLHTTTIDSYCKMMNINRINFLNIHADGEELKVLLGSKEMLKSGNIDYLQLEYSDLYRNSGITLEQVFKYLHSMEYKIFKVVPGSINYIEQFNTVLEDYNKSKFFAINKRLFDLVTGKEPMMFDLKEYCNKYNVVPKGVIHIGAHEGKEFDNYINMGCNSVVYVEANPAVFKRLKSNLLDRNNVTLINCAISNYDGNIDLQLTSFDQSSSILPLKDHLKVYPQIQSVGSVTVPCRKIDSVIKENELPFSSYNILNLDIQGAELMALQGAEELLKHIEIINTEVNFRELYSGSALIHDLDDFLGNHGFIRVETLSPYHPSWGDAIYVKRPVISMSTLGRNGRFANQLFQYAFIKIYAKENNLKVQVPNWIGTELFNLKDELVTEQLPLIRERFVPPLEPSESFNFNTPKPLKNADIWGYFQYHTSWYKPYKNYIRELYKPKEELEPSLIDLVKHLRTLGTTIISLHIRRGDLNCAGDPRWAYYTPIEWYKEWLRGLWDSLENPVLYVASDEPAKVIHHFSEYNPISVSDFGIDPKDLEFYVDFYILSHSDMVAISNSTFSFVATMLNENLVACVRPHRPSEKLIPYDPWNSVPLIWDDFS